ncbi:unnamed protein product [Rotaria magnacalcarata]
MTSDLFTVNDKSQNINSSDNLWFLVDDARCQHVSSNEVLNHPEAFMLFYAKASAHSTPINTSITLLKEQLSRNDSFIDMMTRIPFEDGKFQNKVRSKLTNTILNNEPIFGQTESSITIGNQCSIDRTGENRKNFYHVSNKVLHPSISSKELSFISNELSDDSIAEVSDGDETQMASSNKCIYYHDVRVAHHF